MLLVMFYGMYFVDYLIFSKFMVGRGDFIWWYVLFNFYGVCFKKYFYYRYYIGVFISRYLVKMWRYLL